MKTEYYDELVLAKAEAWDMVYPEIIFLIEARDLPPQGWETLKQAIKHSYGPETKPLDKT